MVSEAFPQIANAPNEVRALKPSILVNAELYAIVKVDPIEVRDDNPSRLVSEEFK